jgi:hypothetical protein
VLYKIEVKEAIRILKRSMYMVEKHGGEAWLSTLTMLLIKEHSIQG